MQVSEAPSPYTVWMHKFSVTVRLVHSMGAESRTSMLSTTAPLASKILAVPTWPRAHAAARAEEPTK